MKNLTPKNEANAREIKMMTGKAMCAYANWMDAIEAKKDDGAGFWTVEQQVGQERIIAGYANEYEATVRCIAMFTVEELPEVCQAIIDNAKEEFGNF